MVSVVLLVVLGGCGNSYMYTGDHTDKDNYGLKITPAVPVVTVGHSLSFTGTSPWGTGAAWSVLPASLGTIDANGRLTAAAVAGRGTVVAMWNNDVRYTATATLSVVPAPVAAIKTASPVVIGQAATASVSAQPGATYLWTVQGGSITGGQGTPELQYTATSLNPAQLSVTVMNAAGDTATGQALASVIDVTPSIRYASAQYTITRGQPITPMRPLSDGGAPVTWTVAPGLPSGLALDPSTGMISGTPTTLSSVVTFTVTATNSGGSAVTSFSLAVVDTAPSIAYSPSFYTFTRGSVIAPVVPSSSGGAITSWSITPALPQGLGFDVGSGRITGTPTGLSAATSYTVTGSNTGGSATASLTFGVVDRVPVIHYDPATETLVRGAEMGSLNPTNTGGAAASWQISPALPVGMAFNAASGVITGTPTTPAPAASFTVTASNSGGTSDPVVLSFTIIDSAPVFSYLPPADTLTLNTAAPGIVPTLTHGTATAWSITPGLPAGLSFDTTSGRVSGSPTVLSPKVNYTVTASNSYGSSTSAPLAITVVDAPPAIAYTPSAYSLTKGTTAPGVVPTNTGGAALSWAISPNPPPGLTFDASNGHLGGTPTALSASAIYSVTATNTGGTSALAVLSLAVVDIPPSIGYSPSVFLFTKGQAISPMLPANTGGTVTSWQISPNLPMGLSFDNSTGRIAGTPTALSAASTYTVTATNSGGTSTPLSLTLSVVDVVPAITYTTPVIVTVNTALPSLAPANTGGAATGWSVHPALPAGLSMDPGTGVISGTPTTTLPGTPFSIVATNTGGSSQPATLTLSVVAAPTATIVASTTNPLYGATVSLTPTFANAVTAAVGTTSGGSDLAAAATSGVSFTTPAITAPRTFYLRATNAAGTAQDASVTVSPQAVNLSAISPAAATRTVSTSTTFSATAAGGVTNGLTWTANGGTIDAASGAWTAPPTPGTYTITAISADDHTKSASTTVTVVSAPSASISASTSSPLFGATVALTPLFTNATSASIGTTAGGTQISAASTSGTAITTVAITSPTTFYLRATDAAGDFQDASVLVTPQTVFVGPISPANPTRTVSTATTFSATATGGVSNGLTWSASAGTIDPVTGVWTAPSAAGSYTITATSNDDATKLVHTTVTIVAVPTAAITASVLNPPFGATVSLNPNFTNATSATIGTARGGSDISAAAASGVAINTAAITATRTFWLRATDAAGDFQDASVAVTPQTVALGAITPASPTRTVSTSTSFSAAVTGGATNSLNWAATGGTIDPATGAWTAPGTVGSYTITATSSDDSTKSVNTMVAVVAAPTATITASSTNPLFGATVSLTPTFANTTTAVVGTSPGASDISAAPVSGTAITSPAITSARTFYLRGTNAAGTSQDASITITPQTVVVNAITPATPTRTVSTTITFSTTANGGLTDGLNWSATGGTMNASTGAWTAPASAGTYTITATSTDDSTKAASTTVHVVAAPTAALTASNTNPAFGAAITLTPSFTNATSATVGTTPGGSDVSAAATSGTVISTGAITAPKTYYLRATDAAGDSQDASVIVTPQTVAVTAITPAAPTRTVSTATTFSATATGGVTNNITWSATGGTMNASTGAWTAPASAGSYTITATSTDDATKSASTTATVVAAPTATITSSTTSPLFGATVTLTPTFTNATTAVVGTTAGGSDISASPTSGTGITSAALTTAKTYYLRATNAAGTQQNASVTVTPQTVAITAITKSASNVSAGYTTTVSAIVTHAQDTSVNWTATGGSFSPANTASGVNSTWTAPATTGTYTITATSNADSTKHTTTTINVVALPVATSLTPSTTSPLRGATVTLTPSFSNGTGSVDNSIGTVTSGTARTTGPITTAVTYTLTVTNTAGQTATIAAPLITPQTVSVDPPVSAATVVTIGNSQTYTAAVHGAAVTTVTWSASGGTITSGGAWTAPSTPGTYTITATSVSDSSKSNSATVRVVSAPVISSFTANDPILSIGGSTTLTGVYTNGVGTASIGTSGSGSSDLTAAASSGVAVATGSLSVTTTFTLAVYNEAGTSTSASTTVTVVAGSASPTVSLSSPRYAHTSTLLPDGRVLIIGGHDDSAVLASSQIYDPSGPSFTEAGPMANARFGHTATLLPNNTVLVAGGNNGTTLAASELWNGSFTSTGSLNTPREKHTATLLLNGQVLLVGGLNGTSPVVTAELYNPSTGNFTYTAGNLNTARYSHTATLLANGKVLIAGGYNGSIPLSSAELFDPSTGSFTVVGSMAQARQRHVAVLLSDGTVAMMGGQGSSAPLATAEIFNPTNSSFSSTTGAMANARDGLSATLIASGKVIVAGGVDGTGNPVKGSEIYDPTAKTFGLTALLATARTQHTATLLQSGKVLLVGGLASGGMASSSAELIDPQDGLTPAIPDATQSAPVGANRAQTGLAASAPSQTHVNYVWMITGGSITAGQGTDAITFSMPSSGTATLDLLVTSDRVVPSHSQFVVTPKPVISAFAPARATVTVGTATTLGWTVQDATSLSINQGVGSVTGTSTPVTVGSLGTNNYTLTATNAGGSTTSSTSITAVAAPVATSLTPASSSVAVGGNTTLIPTFSQGTGSIAPSIGAVTSGPAYPTPAISTPTTFTLTVTNAAGDTATQTATITLQPVSVSAINGPSYLTAGHTGSYTATVSGSVDTTVNWQSTAGSVTAAGQLTAPSVAPYTTTQTPLTLTATSVNGGTPASTTVQIVPLPSITSFTAASSSVGYGVSTTMTPVFTLGTGQIVGYGSVTSGQAVTTGPLTSLTTFTLVVTNLAGDTVSQTVTVGQTTPAVSTPTPTNPTATTGDVLHFSAATQNSANSAVTWSSSPSTSFSGTAWTAPAAGTYTITASSVSPSGYSASTIVTVVDAPVITSFTASPYTVSNGGNANLTGVFSGGTGVLSYSGGSATLTSGTPFNTGALTSTTSYTLMVTNGAGKSVSRTVTINVVNGNTSTSPSTMAASRSGHTITLLADGSVLIAGGANSTTAERYTSGSLSALSSPMQAVRLHHTATLLADGRVLLTGGADGSGNSQNTAELFNPANNSFTASASTMTAARQRHTAALLPDGRVVLSGGLDASGNPLLTSEIYDPIADTFTVAASMSTAREFAQATSLGSGNVLITGGDTTSSATNSAQLFDGTSYSSLSLTQPRSQHTATLLGNGNVLLIGGTQDLSNGLSTSEVYNGSSLATSAPIGSPRFGHTANLLASGDVFVTGGTPDGNSAIGTSFIFDPVAPQVYTTASLTTARFQASSTILRNGTVLISGGSSTPADTSGSALNSIEIFDPQDGLSPVLPNATVTAPSSASNNATGLAASVPAQSNVRYIWSLTNGTITAGLNTNSINFTHGTGTSVLNVLVVNDREVPSQSTLSIAPSSGPVISSFAASPSPSTIGLATTLNWSVSGGSGLALSIDHGVGTVTGSSTTITTPSTTTTYTLTATDANGTSTRTAILTAVAAPLATSLTPASASVEKGASTTLVPTFSNGTGSINGIGTVSSGVAYPTGILNTATPFTLTVTNAAGTTAITSLTVNVDTVAVASISGPTNVTVSSSSAQYTANVTGAVDGTVSWSTSGGTITAAGLLTAPATVGDIIITATSNADPTKSASLTVHIVAAPSATGLTAATNPVLYGASTTVTPQFSNGTGAINQGIGSVSSGTAYTTGTITADKTFTLTVTSPAGDTATYPLTVHPQTVTVGPISGPATGYVTVNHTATFSATVTGAVDTSITWTATGGSFTGSTWTAPSTPGPYTITGTAVSGATNTLSVTVVPAPAIASFSASPIGINKNQTSTLSGAFTGAGTGANALGTITPGPLSITSGSGVSTPALASSQTYTLTVTNDAGDSATAQTAVQVFLGAFSATSNSLATPRNAPTAVLGADGNVLIAGGGTGSNAADLFSSTSLSFSSTGNLVTGRNGHTETLLPNGLILIAGGISGATSLNSAELYNPATHTFTSAGSLQQPRKNHDAILLDSGKVLLVGGTGLASAELYDPVAGTFTLVGSMASARDAATASRLPDGRILVAGGGSGATRLASAEIFDPSSNTFSTAANLLTARQNHTATTLPSGKVLIAGGTGSTATGSAELFDPSLLRFVSTGDMVQPRQQHSATLLSGGMVLFAGGNSAITSTVIDQAELYDPSQGAFLKTDFMSTTGQPTTGAAASLLPTGQVLVTGGTTDGSNATVGSELYTPTDGLAAASANATITAPAYVARAATNVSAHVTAAAGARYVWSVTNGTLVSGQGTAGITLNMPASGGATVDVLILTPQAIPSHGQAVIVGEAAPTITSFTAATSPVLYGASTTITPVFSNADASAVIGTGAAGTSDVTASAVSSTAVNVAPLTAPQQYRLTVTNLAGVSANQTVTVNVDSVIVSAVSPASPTLSTGATQTFTSSVSQAVNTGITWSATGGTIDPATGIWTAPSTPGTYTIRATAQADNTTYASTTATVVALPAIQSFSASTSAVNFGQAPSLTAVFTGAANNHASIGTSGTGSADVSSSVTSGTAVNAAALSTTTTYTLTVTNSVGASATATTTVTVNQPFSITGAMALARTGETATLLPDGSVLVAGGTTAADVAERYTTSGSTFTATQAMQTARRRHTATLLATGQVLITGGDDANGSAQNTAELFDLSTGSFTLTSGTMAHARRNHVAALLPDGRVLLAGGSNSTENQLASAEIFDPATGTFSTVATSLTTAREFSTATTLVDGRVLIAGGYTGSAYSASADIFTTAGAFNGAALSMGAARSHGTATLLPSGQVLLAGGYDGTNRLATSLLFTPGSPDTFAAAGAMAQARQDATATLLAGGDILLAGGSNGTIPLATAELFSPSGSAFSTTGNLTNARTVAAASLLLDGTTLVAGGIGTSGVPLNSAELFNAQDAATPFQPVATITPSATHAYVASTGLTASAATHTGNRYIWSIHNGSITAGQGTASITFALASSGDAVLDLLVISDHLVPAHSRSTVTADPLPAVVSFTAAANPIPFGGSTTITPVFTNATGVKLGTSGYGSSDVSSSVTSGVAIGIGPLTAATTYTLTLPTVNGNVQSQALTLNVLPVAISSITPTAPIVTAGHTATFSAAVTQAVNTTVNWSANGGSITSAGIWTAPSTPGTYTITATAAADNTTSASTTVTVVALPTIQSFTASSTALTPGQSTTLTPTFTAPSGSTAIIGTSGSGSSQLTSTAASGNAYSTGALTTTTTFTLTVTNAAGDIATQSVQVTVAQPFTATGSLAAPRVGQTTTILADGSVLVAGGASTASPAEVYASSGTFTSTSAMQGTRSDHTATLLADGRVLLTGGFDGTNQVATAEIYDPSTQSFTATAGTMTHARQNHSAALLPDGRVLILGGYNSSENVLASAEIWDPSTGAFTSTSSTLVNARQYATATALPNGDIMIAGGTGSGNTVLNSAELFSAGSFGTQSFLLRSPRSRHTATLLPSGQVLLAGGSDGSAALSSAELYTGGNTNSSFTTVTNTMLSPRENHTVTLLAGGKVLLAGGTDGTAPLAAAEIFDPSAQTFTTAGTMVTPRLNATATLLQTGKVLLLGGTDGSSSPLASAELFDPMDGLVPALPSLQLSAPANANFSSPVSASITLPSQATVIWSLSNASINSGTGTSSLSFTMPASGSATVHVLVFTSAGLPINASREVLGQ